MRKLPLLAVIQQCQKQEVKDYSPLIEQATKTLESVHQTQTELLKETQIVNANVDSLIKIAPQPQEKNTKTK